MLYVSAPSVMTGQYRADDPAVAYRRKTGFGISFQVFSDALSAVVGRIESHSGSVQPDTVYAVIVVNSHDPYFDFVLAHLILLS